MIELIKIIPIILFKMKINQTTYQPRGLKMLKKIERAMIINLLLVVFILSPVSADSVDNSLFTDLLKKHVTGPRVDYAGFKTDEAQLDQYLDILSRTDHASLSSAEQFAFFVNVYNAFTIKLVLTEYPGIDSIKDIGSFFSTPWKIRFIPLKDQKVTLDEVEHEILRPTFKDPRIHFAVNCASIGCPPLRPEAFEGDRLEEQLNEQTTAFINGPGNVKIDGNTIYVSKIFRWFKEDFTEGPVSFVRQYASPDLLARIDAMGDNIRVKYLDYDWALNK